MIPTLMGAWRILLASGLLYETVAIAADTHFHPQVAERRGLHCHGLVGGCGAGRISHLDMVGFVTGHHLIARDAVSHGVHDGPLRSGDPPSAFRFFARQIAHAGASEIGFQTAAFHEDAAPNDLARFADAFHRPAAEPEVHGRLALTYLTGIPPDEVLGRRSAADLEHPHEFALVIFPVAHIVQRRFRIVAELGPDAIGEQRIQTGAFIHFIEMGKRAAGIKLAIIAREDWWTVYIIEQSFG